MICFLSLGTFIESDDSYGFQPSSNLPSNIEFLTWVSSGACDVDASFSTEISGSLSASSMSLISLSSKDAPWRNILLQRLRTRDETENAISDQYEEAISQVCRNNKQTNSYYLHVHRKLSVKTFFFP